MANSRADWGEGVAIQNGGVKLRTAVPEKTMPARFPAPA